MAQNEASPGAIAALIRDGKVATATRLAGQLLTETVGQAPLGVRLTNDEYSLNSVSGRAKFPGQPERFFKFHTEGDEQATVSEYYRAELLTNAQLPVEVPLTVSTRPGHQMAVYELRTEPRLADVCLALERASGREAILPTSLLRARRELDARIGAVACKTMLPPTPASQDAAIHQLFWRRMVEPDGRYPGGRFGRWYADDPTWQRLADRRWVVNGVEYLSTLAELTAAALTLLDPAVLVAQPVVTAHGDDHQGNVWVLGGELNCRLSMFDPAFAGTEIPALLAPIKATFHNVLAHPMWLYTPDEVDDRYRVEVEIDERVAVHDNIELSLLRKQILRSVVELVWLPLLRQLHRLGLLPEEWRATVRAALFACPLLVTNLLAPTRSRTVQLVGLARAVAGGSEPAEGHHDLLSTTLDELSHALDQTDDRNDLEGKDPV